VQPNFTLSEKKRDMLLFLEKEPVGGMTKENRISFPFEEVKVIEESTERNRQFFGKSLSFPGIIAVNQPD
jgi:hypothetical protein